MLNFKFQELCGQDFDQESVYFRTLVKYCREMFHCSIEEIVSLVGKMLAGESGQVKAHVIYADSCGEMTGFIIFYYYPQNKVGFIEAIVVMENYRDQGVGSLLYWRMVDFLKKNYPECIGHILEMCQDRENYLKRKAFFLKQGCIPLALDFFILDPEINKSGIQILYHPYRLNQEYSLNTLEEILREMSKDTIH